MPHHKVPTVESSGASLSAAAGGGGAPPSNRALVARAASGSRLGTRTIVETAACPPELRHGDAPWQALLAGSFSEFRVQRMLGEGSMSSVVHCVCARTGAHCAVKMYHRDRMNAMNVKQVGREIEIHASLLHPHILRLFAAFEDADGIYLVQEWAARGDLYVELSRRGGYMPEAHVVKHVMVPFLSALTYMHTQGILHRDIKPENIMLGGDGGVRLGDFGLAINTTREKPMSRVGTLDYMPPEIVRLPYGAAAAAAPRPPPGAEGGAAYGLPVDAWCCGVLAYELLLGSPPFEADSKDATYTRILKLEPGLPSQLSDQARDFIRAALSKDPAKRPTVHQLLRHPWLRTHQRPQSMVVLEPKKELVPAAPLASPMPPATGVTVTALAGPERPTSSAAEAAAGAADKQDDGRRSPAGAALSASAPAAPGSLSARPTPMSKSLSFNSTMAGRFSAVKPSKPSPLSLLLRSKARSKPGSPAASRAASAGAGEGRSRDTAALVAAAAVAEIEAEAAAAAAASKAASGERMVVHVQAAAGAAATAALAAAAAAAAAAPAAAAAAGDDDLIPAALPDGTTRDGGSGSGNSGHGARGSLIASIKRKLSSAGGKGMSLFAPAGPEAGPKDEAAAMAAAAAAAATAAAVGCSGVGTIPAVPMQQLLAGPRSGGDQLKRTHSGRLQALALGFSRKLSLAGRRKSGAAPAAVGDAQGNSRLATSATA